MTTPDKSERHPREFLMRAFPRLLVTLAAVTLGLSPGRAESLVENGDFENPEPFKGWVTDYGWTGNKHYVDNKTHVSLVTESGHRNVVEMGLNGDAGVKLESRAFTREPGFRYTCTLDVKGGSYRIYFVGYRWAPGIAPHDNPELSELRKIYQSKAAQGDASGWKQETIEIPGVSLSADAIAHMKDIRFLSVYIWFLGPGFVDNVKVTRIADPAMKF